MHSFLHFIIITSDHPCVTIALATTLIQAPLFSQTISTFSFCISP